MAPWLQNKAFTRVLCSPALRARQTCELAGLGADRVIEAALAEWDYGDYEGRRSDEIHQQRPDWSVWRDGCPGGEMPAQISQRADRLLTRLRGFTGNIALFSHGQFGPALAARWIGLPIGDGQHFALSPASLSILAQEPDHPEITAITLWNARPRGIDGPMIE